MNKIFGGSSATIKDDCIIMKTIREFNSSYMLANFSQDDNTLTGAWHEITNFDGNYSGAMGPAT